MANTAAFFDIDGTLYREGLITETFKKMIKNDMIESRRWHTEVRDHFVKWDKRQGNYDDYLVKMAEVYIETIKGLHRIQMEFVARKVVEQKGDRVYTYTRNRILWHKDRGHKVLTISGSPIELVREMAAKHGFDDHRGSRYLYDEQGFYTGEVHPMWNSVNKQLALDELVQKYDLDLAQCYAYGDTAGDYAMLKLVGHPVAMNPTRELITKIKEDADLCARIQFIVERKDMIYCLKPQDIDLTL